MYARLDPFICISPLPYDLTLTHTPPPQLAEDETFYTCLVEMGCGDKSPQKSEGFARTIMLKLNMQLSTDTMRGSLEADWALLSDEVRACTKGAK